MAERKDVLEVIEDLLLVFPDGRLDQQGIELYVNDLLDISLWHLLRASERLRHKNKWFPRIAEILEAVQAVTNETEDDDQVLIEAKRLQGWHIQLKHAFHREGVFDESEWLALIRAFERIGYKGNADTTRKDLHHIHEQIKNWQDDPKSASLE